MFFGCNLSSMNPLKCVSMNNKEYKVRPEIVNVNSNEPVFFTFSIRTSKSSCSCNCNITMIAMLNCVFLMRLKI